MEMSVKTQYISGDSAGGDVGAWMEDGVLGSKISDPKGFSLWTSVETLVKRPPTASN